MKKSSFLSYNIKFIFLLIKLKIRIKIKKCKKNNKWYFENIYFEVFLF